MTTITETDRVLAGMFTENTGRHFLDSGGAYGRNWERNHALTVEDFLAAPKITADARYGCLDVTLDAFHWLRDRLEYDPKVQRMFEVYVWMRDQPYDPWLVEAEAFAEACEEKYGDLSYRSDTLNTVNTCNHESLLSQVLQYVTFTGPDGDTYVMLQVHGGCDVRGGYTKPKAFRITDYEGAYSLYEDNEYELYCSGGDHDGDTMPGMPDDEPHALTYRGEWITWGGSFTTDPWADAGVDMIYEDEETGESFVRCPYCSEPSRMEAYALEH